MSRRSIHRAKRNSMWEEGTDNHGQRSWRRRIRGLPHNDNLPRADVKSPFKKSKHVLDSRTGTIRAIPGRQVLAMNYAFNENYHIPICTRATRRA